jgi:RimJ/RimL family protein N-acetyltransferase
MSPWPQRIETERLVLRTWQDEDARALGVAIAESLDHLLPWMPWAAAEPVALEDRRKLIAQWDRAWRVGEEVVYGVFFDGTVVGGSGLHRRIGPTGLEIGYWIHADYLRRGFASEVAAALTDIAFSLEGIERVEIHHDRANVASGWVPRTLGYGFVRERPDEVTSPGETGVDCTWSVARTEWFSRP